MKQERVKKMFWEILPKWDKGRHKGNVNWYECIGQKVKFQYDDLEGELEIINFDKNTRCLYLKYLDKEPFKIHLPAFQNCQIGSSLGLGEFAYKYKIGDIVKTKTGNIKILEQIRMDKSRKSEKYTEKGYKYECLEDYYIGEIYEYSLTYDTGCPVCSNRIIVKGINDIATTHPHLVKYFVNIEDTYIHSYGYDGKVLLKCPDCGFEREQIMNVLTSYYKNGFICSNCGDGISYPEKFMNNVLRQLNIKFETHKLFDWSRNIIHKDKKLNGNKLYDFYIPSLNCIIETHGEQHYENSFSTIKHSSKTLKEEQENDKIKKELAIQNGIKDENYIVIDCRRAEFKWVKDNILKSKLNDLFCLLQINWIECGRYASSSLIKTASELWEQGIKSNIKIAEIIGVDRHTVQRYLKQGNILGFCSYKTKNEIKKENILKVCKLWKIYDGNTLEIEQNSEFKRPTILRYLKEASKLGLCNYNPKEEVLKSIEVNAKLHEKQVICLELNQIFSSSKEIEEKSLELFKVKLQACTIRDVCTGRYKYKQYKGFTFKYII